MLATIATKPVNKDISILFAELLSPSPEKSSVSALLVMTVVVGFTTRPMKRISLDLSS